jgi:predicted O-methyltransferase YrrM
MEYDETLEHYIKQHSDSEDEILKEIFRETHLKMMQPRMLSGRLQGQILESFSRMIQPQLIVELGTFTGYSAICLAKGLAVGGKIISIEADDEVIGIAKQFVSKSKFSEQIDIRLGDAKTEIDLLPNDIDLAFIDAEKSEYLEYYQKLLPKMKTGAYLIADNVLWSGKVFDSEIKNNDYSTKGIIAFNDYVQQDTRVSNYILPIRDGMMIIRKL